MLLLKGNRQAGGLTILSSSFYYTVTIEGKDVTEASTSYVYMKNSLIIDKRCPKMEETELSIRS